MDINLKEKIEELVKKITANESLRSGFAKNPVATVEKLLGVDLPDEQIQKLVDGIRAKLTADKLSDAAGSILNLFGGDKK